MNVVADFIEQLSCDSFLNDKEEKPSGMYIELYIKS